MAKLERNGVPGTPQTVWWEELEKEEKPEPQPGDDDWTDLEWCVNTDYWGELWWVEEPSNFTWEHFEAYRLRRLYGEGITWQKIGDQLGVTAGTACSYGLSVARGLLLDAVDRDDIFTSLKWLKKFAVRTRWRRASVEKRRAEAFRLRAKGLTMQAIARRLDLSVSRISNILARESTLVGKHARREALLAKWAAERRRHERATRKHRPLDMGGPRERWLEFRLGDGQP